MQQVRPRRSVLKNPQPWVGPVLLLTAASPALAGLKLSTTNEAKPLGPALVAIDQIDQPGIRRASFVLSEDTALHVRAEGVGDEKGRTFLAQGWILNLKTRRPVWTMADVGCCYDDDAENYRAEGDVTLPAGSYGVYFAAFGGRLPMNSDLTILGIKLGKINADYGPVVKWDDEGDPERWGIWVNAKSRDFRPESVPARVAEPFPDAVVRSIGLEEEARKRVGLALDRAVRFRLWATGEWWEGADTFADGAWIIDRDHWKRVWQLTRENTEPAGGADKNRLFDDEITLPAGNYVITAFTDDSHSTGKWNDAPPWDPDSWGVALTPVDPGDRAACHVSDQIKMPSPTLEITRVGDNQSLRKPFRVKKATSVLVHALGERSGGTWADFGWIETRSTLEPVWDMDSIPSFPAGGASKNREIESVVDLPVGSYNLCYATDDSHSYPDWNTDPPYDPEDWGISLTTVSGHSSDIVVGETPDDPIAVSLAPVKSGQHLVKRFTSEGNTRVLLIAVGEGVEDEMADYGWLERVDTGERVWEMRIEETHWAGGAKKNREQRLVLTLPAGTYALHYETDDSHAYDDWNAVPPRQPQLWGVTLIELPPGMNYTPRYKSESLSTDDDAPSFHIIYDGGEEKGSMDVKIKGNLDQLRDKFRKKAEELKAQKEREKKTGK